MSFVPVGTKEPRIKPGFGHSQMRPCVCAKLLFGLHSIGASMQSLVTPCSNSLGVPSHVDWRAMTFQLPHLGLHFMCLGGKSYRTAPRACHGCEGDGDHRPTTAIGSYRNASAFIPTFVFLLAVQDNSEERSRTLRALKIPIRLVHLTFMRHRVACSVRRDGWIDLHADALASDFGEGRPVHLRAGEPNRFQFSGRYKSDMSQLRLRPITFM